MARVGVANRAIIPSCPHVNTLNFRDLYFFLVSASYEAFTKNSIWMKTTRHTECIGLRISNRVHIMRNYIYATNY